MPDVCPRCGARLESTALGALCPACLMDSLTEPPSIPGARVFGEYELLEEIGRGGMGVVYRAWQPRLKRSVAVKMLLANQAGGRDFMARFRREATVAAGLRHPGIATVFEAGEVDGQPYFAMELLEGRSLADLTRSGPLPADEAARHLLQVAEAVAYSHEQNVLHRDLKPSNIIVEAHGQAKVVDFGLARSWQSADASELTLSATTLGSPPYMAPEQAAGREVGPATDVHGLGAVLYHLLTGRPPHSGATPQEVLLHVRDATVVAPRLVNPSVPRDLETICLKCLEKEPNRRYPSARAVAEDLARFLAKKPVLARPVGPLGRCARWARRNPGLAAALLALALAVTSVGVVSSVSALRLNRQNVQLSQQSAEIMARNAEIVTRDADLRQTVARLEFTRVVSLLDSGDVSGAVALLARRLRAEPDNRRAAEFALSILMRRNLARPVGPPIENVPRIQSAAFRHDGKQAAFAGMDGMIRVMDAATGRQLGQPWSAESPNVAAIFRGERAIRALAYSPDDSVLAGIRRDGQVFLWNAATGQRDAAERRHVMPAEYVRERHDEVDLGLLDFHPKGEWLATASRGHAEVVLWSMRENKALRLSHPLPALCVRWSPDGRRLLTACGDGAIRLWDTEGSLVEQPLSPGPEPILFAAFSPQGDLLAAASRGEEARLLDRRTGTWKSLPCRGPVRLLAFSPDGRSLATADEEAVRVWDTLSGQRRYILSLPARCNWLGYRSRPHGGPVLTTGGYDLAVRFWRGDTGEPILQPLRHADPIFGVAWSRDGPQCLTTGLDGVAQMWRLSSGSSLGEFAEDERFPPRRLPVPNAGVACPIYFTENGRSILAGTQSMGFHFLSLENDEVRRLPVSDFPIWRLVVSPNGKFFASATEEQQYLLGEVATARVLARYAFQRALSMRGMAFSPASDLLAIAEDRAVRVLEIPSGKTRHRLETPFIPDELAFHPTAPRVAIGATTGPVMTWNLVTNEIIKIQPGHRNGVMSLAFSVDGRRLITGSADNTARVWDAETGQPVVVGGKELVLRHSHTVWPMSRSPDGRSLLTGSPEGTVRLWDLETGATRVQAMKHLGEITAADFSRDGARILTASIDGTVRIWDAASGLPISDAVTHPSPVWYASLNEQGTLLLTRDAQGTARLFEIAPVDENPPAWLPEALEAAVGQRLTPDGITELVSSREFFRQRERLAKESTGGVCLSVMRRYFGE